MPLFRGSSRFESLILSHHFRFTRECNKEEINDDDDASHHDGSHDGSHLNPNPETRNPKPETRNPRPET